MTVTFSTTAPASAGTPARPATCTSIDASGLQSLDDLLKQTRREGATILLTGLHAQTLEAIERSGLLDRLGRENSHSSLDEALDRAREILATVREP